MMDDIIREDIETIKSNVKAEFFAAKEGSSDWRRRIYRQLAL